MTYRYCTVRLPFGVYWYQMQDPRIRCGSRVIVAINSGMWFLGVVEEIRQVTEATAPYPPYATRFILQLAGRNAAQQIEQHNRAYGFIAPPAPKRTPPAPTAKPRRKPPAKAQKPLWDPEMDDDEFMELMEELDQFN